jgi:hypothetical protein
MAGEYYILTRRDATPHSNVGRVNNSKKINNLIYSYW